MKNVVIASVVLLGLTTPSYAWYPDRLPVQVKQPIQVAQAYPSPNVPAYPPVRRSGAKMQTSSCSPFPCGYGGVGGGNVGPNVGNGLGIPAYIYDSGIGAPNLYALPY